MRTLAFLGFSLGVRDPNTTTNCATTSRAGDLGLTVAVCQREYAQTHAPATGARLAEALQRSRNPDAASAVARDLLLTDERGTALQILGKIAIEQHRLDEGKTALETARAIHRDRGEYGAAARDGQALARVFNERDQFAEALIVLDECLVDAARGNDRVIEGYCRLSAARVLGNAGNFALATDELDRAERLAETDRDRAWLAFERGNLDQGLSRMPLQGPHSARAVASFERTIALATRVRLPKLVLIGHLNAVYSLAELGRLDEAEQHLVEANQLDVGDGFVVDRRILAARIAYYRRSHRLAFLLAAAVYPDARDADDRLQLAALQARNAMALGEAELAVHWARRGVDEAEALRSRQTAAELRPWVLARRREPYELWFAALARSGRAKDALLAFGSWQGRTMLDNMTGAGAGMDLRSAAGELTRVGSWRLTASAALARDSDPAAIEQVLARIDILALALADRDVFAITARRGDVRVHVLGSYDDLRERFARFTAAPSGPLATELGALILRDGVGAPTTTPLYAVLDGPLAGLPLVALRDAESKPLVANRPVARLMRLPAATCNAGPSPTHATIIADAAGNLEAAAREAREIAALLPGADVHIGAKATREALFTTPPGAILHLAVHASLSAAGGALELHDVNVPAVELAASQLAPSLVMISGCGTAAAHDSELAGSLATGFLVTGARRVIATTRPVSDEGARELANEFYRRGGATDPITVLAEIQARLASSENRDWWSYTIFQTTRCITTSGEQR